MLPRFLNYFNTPLRHRFFSWLGLGNASLSEVTIPSQKLQELIQQFISLNCNGIVPRYIVNISDDDLLHAFFFLTCRAIGSVYVPVNPATDPGTVLDILGNSTDIVIYKDGSKEQTLSDNYLNGGNELPANSTHRTENEDALVIFTSGSTGRPKGVVHTVQSLKASFQNQGAVFGYFGEYNWLSSLPAFHIGGMSVISRATFSGAGLFFPAERKKQELLNAIAAFSPSLFSLVPTQLQQFINSGFKGYNGLKYIFVGGGPTDNALLFNAIHQGIPIVKCYGSSETASFITASSPEEFLKKPESAGKPIPGVTVSIQSGSNKSVATGGHGEAVITSPTLFSRYLNNPEETALKLHGNSYLSGDEGYMDDDGFLYLTGRKNRIIISGGENIAAAEVENILKSLPEITDALVLGIKDEYWGEKICAALIPASETQNEEELLSKIKSVMPPVKQPKLIRLYSSLPVTELGKTDLNKLKSDFGEVQQ